MYQTEDIKELVSALSKAQGKMKPAVFNKANPHFKNRYADFTSCMDACRIPLAENGLSIMQYCELVNDKLTLVTMLAHTSGQWIKSHFPLNPVSMTSQAIGSAMTYGKRYTLAAMLGIVSDEEEDDDGEAAHGRGKSVEQPKPVVPVIAKQEPVRIPSKINGNQVAILKKLDERLDKESRNKMYSWMLSCYKISSIEDILVENFTRILSGFENAVKFIEQEKLELAHA